MTSITFTLHDNQVRQPDVEITIKVDQRFGGENSAETDLAYVELIAKACRARVEDLFIEMEQKRAELVSVAVISAGSGS